jgi:glycosyltransferase involved in cell wall biosynthesis
MKVLTISTDNKIFEENSAVRQRMVEYGKLFEELHIVVFALKNMKLNAKNLKIGNNIWLYPTNSVSKAFYIWDAFGIGKILGSKLKFSNCVISSQDPFETGLAGALIKLFCGLPLQVQIHTDLMHKYFRQSSVLNRIRFFVAEFILRDADRVRVVSERIKKSISHFSQNVDVLPIKMEIKEGFEEEIKKPFPFTLLMVCRLEKEKNIETVLQAIKNLNNENIGLCVVGDGSQKAYLEKMAKNMDISEKIIFVGWQNN